MSPKRLPNPLAPRSLALLALPALLAVSCGGEAGTGPVSRPAEDPGADAATEPAAAPEEGTPTSQDVAAAVLDSRAAGDDFQLETEYDLAALNEELAGEPQEAAPAPETAEPVHLDRTSQRFLGGISMFEGEKTHSFGTVRAGESRQHEFQFVSDGKEPLTITSVKPSCGCTRADIERVDAEGNASEYVRGEELAIGDRFQLVAEMSTEGKHGHVAATVSIYTNSPGGAFNVRLEADVEPVIDVEPETAIYFGQMTTADRLEREVTVKSHRGEPFLLTADVAGLKGIALELLPQEPDADGRAAVWTVKVAAGPGLPIGVRNYPAVLHTDLEVPSPKYPSADGGPKYHTVPLSVQARVTGLVHAEPAFVGFGMIRPGEPLERVVRVACADEFELSAETEVVLEGLYGGPFEYADRIETTNEIVEVDGKRQLLVRMNLTGMPEDLNGSFGGVLKILVAHPEMDEILVRFSGVCRAPLPTVGGGN